MGRITIRTPAFSYRNGEDPKKGIVAGVILSGINQGCSFENRNVIGFFLSLEAVFSTC